MAEDDAFLDKAIEGLVLFAFNKGEVCTCPSRALIHESIYDEFMERCLERIDAIQQGHPLDPSTMLGPQVSSRSSRRSSATEVGLDEGAELLIGGRGPSWAANSQAATSSSPPCSRGTTRCESSRRGSSTRPRGHHVQGRGRGARDRQRHDVRPRRRRVDSRRLPRVPDGPRDPGGSRVDQLLPPVPGPRRIGGYKDSGVGPRTIG